MARGRVRIADELTAAIYTRGSTIVQAVHRENTAIDLRIGASLTDRVAGVVRRLKVCHSGAGVSSISPGSGPAIEAIQRQGDQLAGELNLAPTAIADALQHPRVVF